MKINTKSTSAINDHGHCMLLVLLLLAIFSFTQTTMADDTTENALGLVVADAVVTPAKPGESARLRLKITNFGSESLSLRALHSDVAISTKMIMTTPGIGQHVVSDLTILRDETLDLASSHIRVELQDIQKEIKPGSNIEFALFFRRFVTKATAHAH